MTYEFEIDLNTPYKPTKEEIIGMFDEGSDVVDNDPVEEVHNVQLVMWRKIE